MKKDLQTKQAELASVERLYEISDPEGLFAASMEAQEKRAQKQSIAKSEKNEAVNAESNNSETKIEVKATLPSSFSKRDKQVFNNTQSITLIVLKLHSIV